MATDIGGGVNELPIKVASIETESPLKKMQRLERHQRN